MECSRVSIVLLKEVAGECNELLLSAASSVRLNILVRFAITVLVEFDGGKFRDLVTLSKSTILIGINDGKTYLSTKLPGSFDKTRFGEFAVVAPLGSKHDEPDLVAFEDNVVVSLVIKADEVAVLVLVRDVGVGDVLLAVALDAELLNIVAIALRHEVLNDLLAILEGEHLDEWGAVDAEVVAELRVSRNIDSAIVNLVMAVG